MRAGRLTAAGADGVTDDSDGGASTIVVSIGRVPAAGGANARATVRAGFASTGGGGLTGGGKLAGFAVCTASAFAGACSDFFASSGFFTSSGRARPEGAGSPDFSAGNFSAGELLAGGAAGAGELTAGVLTDAVTAGLGELAAGFLPCPARRYAVKPMARIVPPITVIPAGDVAKFLELPDGFLSSSCGANSVRPACAE